MGFEELAVMPGAGCSIASNGMPRDALLANAGEKDGD